MWTVSACAVVWHVASAVAGSWVAETYRWLISQTCFDIKRKMWCMWEVRRRKKLLLPNCVNVWVGAPGALTVFQFLPMALAAQTSQREREIKRRNIAHCRSPWLCQPLWRRKHFNSPLSSICACGGSHGCRRPLFITTDRLQICWFAELWEGAGCVSASLWWSGRWSRTDGGGNHSAFPTAAVDSFTPAAWRCLMSSFHSSLGESPANRLGWQFNLWDKPTNSWCGGMKMWYFLLRILLVYFSIKSVLNQVIVCSVSQIRKFTVSNLNPW